MAKAADEADAATHEVKHEKVKKTAHITKTAHSFNPAAHRAFALLACVQDESSETTGTMVDESATQGSKICVEYEPRKKRVHFQVADTDASTCARCEKKFHYYLHDCACDDCSSYFVCKVCKMRHGKGCGNCAKARAAVEAARTAARNNARKAEAGKPHVFTNVFRTV